MTASSDPRRALAAHVVPFAIFMAGIALRDLVGRFAGGSGGLLWQHPEYWIYPLQTFACGLSLVYFWGEYHFGGRGRWLLAAAVGLVVLGIWVSPQAVFGWGPRLEGFDPTVFSGSPLLYGLALTARFARLVVVVPMVEEIFWRGFLMRYLVRENFQEVAFGTFRPASFFCVAGLFMFGHAMADWPAAFMAGLIYNDLAVWTRSLSACVIAHAATNLGLGIYILSTRQWGFW